MAFGRSKKRYDPGHEIGWLVAGLGNPGTEYEDTPHNVGFLVIEALAAERRVAMVPKHDGMYGVGQVDGVEEDVALLRPLTYMNLSGRSVKPAMKAAGVGVDRLVVVHDEVDLPFGEVRVKHDGGLAGHNGLKSITEALGTRAYTRVRVGIGRPGPGDRRPLRDYVLAPWSQPRGEVEQLVADAADAVRDVLARGVRAAMNRHNGGARKGG